MQREYKPDGWLGMIKGTKLFFDFSGKYDFNKKLIELSRELGERGKGMEADTVDVSVLDAYEYIEFTYFASVKQWTNCVK